MCFKLWHACACVIFYEYRDGVDPTPTPTPTSTQAKPPTRARLRRAILKLLKKNVRIVSRIEIYLVIYLVGFVG